MYSNYLCRFTDEMNRVAEDEMKYIVPLSEMDSLLFVDEYFSDTIKYATVLERSYGEPIMSHIFDEGEIDAVRISEILRALHPDNTTVYFFWDIHSAVKTNWNVLVKYWDNFCWSGDDAIIFINPKEVYLYSDMILRKINRTKEITKPTSDDFLLSLGDIQERRVLSLESLIKGFPKDAQARLFSTFHTISETASLLTDNTEYLPKEYIELVFKIVHLIKVYMITALKPYSPNNNKKQDVWFSESVNSIDSLVNQFVNSLK